MHYHDAVINTYNALVDRQIKSFDELDSIGYGDAARVDIGSVVKAILTKSGMARVDMGNETSHVSLKDLMSVKKTPIHADTLDATVNMVSEFVKFITCLQRILLLGNEIYLVTNDDESVKILLWHPVSDDTTVLRAAANMCDDYAILDYNIKSIGKYTAEPYSIDMLLSYTEQ